MKKLISIFLGLFLLLGFTSVVQAYTAPSTNDINRTNGWAHVNAIPGIGEVALELVQPRAIFSCFEYRTDGDTSQVIDEEHFLEFYGVVPVSEGLQQYPYDCLSTISTLAKTIPANEYVEVRMIFGGEGDERFNWTRFDVLYPRTAVITAPTAGQDVYGMVDFTAYLDDDDVDSIQWAVRQGTCAAGVGTVFGNVDGHSDVATMDTSDLSMQTFSFTGDMSAMTLGSYCFIYNPREDNGESNIRETVEFNLVEEVGPPTDKNECKKDGWMTFNNPFFRNQGDCVSYVQSNENAKGNRKDN
ncbi:hypothetical protein ACFLZ1_01180 [Patescibacteria group bacterium]